MLVIGIFIGIALIMVFRTPHDSDREGVAWNRTPSGATSSDILLSATTSRTETLSSALPELPRIPDNVRVGLSVLDQPAGKTVSVSSLEISGTQWVAIYDDKDGRPGWILGAARVHEGDKTTAVELLRPEGMISGNIYYAAILNDDGDSEFNRLTDLPPFSPDKIIIVRFKAI